MEIPKTIAVVSEAWTAAEAKLVEEVAKYSAGLGEEAITERVFGLLQEKLDDSSRNGFLEDAFAEDLSNSHPGIQIGRTENLSQGLVAEVLHNKRFEGKVSGADFGLVLSSPEVARGADKIYLSQNRTGLLCQAKLKRKTWGQLKPCQKKFCQST